ncbi:MAG: alanine racemase [Pseudomonadota bacterium]
MNKTHIDINLGHLAHNYHALREMAPTAEACSAVVKADAYGCGVQQVVERLCHEECQIFFVATYQEGVAVRQINKDIIIYVLEGLTSHQISDYKAHDLRPVINDLASFKDIKTLKMQAALHIDTAMNRLGLSLNDYFTIKDMIDDMVISQDISLLMSHLSVADHISHPLNKQQIEKVQNIAKNHPHAKMSLANSMGVLHHPDTHFDILRPGIALYGGVSHPKLRHIVTLSGQILQIRQIESGDTVGYGATFTAQKPMIIATISGGYADGIPRSLSNTDFAVFYNGYRFPLIGRVSMDSLICDVSDYPQIDQLHQEWVEIFGPHNPLDECAELAHTISYEILTHLSARGERTYIGCASS